MVILAVAAILAQGPQVSTDVLEAEPKFTAPAAFRCAAEPLSAVCKKLADATGAQIEASKSLENDIIVLYTAPRPARETMAKLGTHFGWTWTKVGSIYKLVQTPEARKAEEVALIQSEHRPCLALQGTARKALADAAKIDKAALAKQRADLDAEIEKLAQPEGQDYDEAKAAQLGRLYEQRGKLMALDDPYTVFANAVYASLSPQRLTEMLNRLRLVLSYRPTSWQGSLGAQGSKAAERLVADLTKPRQDGSSTTKTLNANSIATVRIVLAAQRGFLTRNNEGVSAEITVVGKDGSLLAQGTAYLSATEDAASPTSLGPTKTRLDEPLKATRDLKADLAPTRSGMQGFFKRITEFLAAGSTTDPLAPVAEALIGIAESAHTAVICDAYDADLAIIGEKGLSGNTASSLFNAYAGATGAKWTFDGDWVAIRKTDWAEARAGSVPRNIVFSCRDRFIEQAGLSVDELADLAAKVTDRQARSFVMLLFTGFSWISVSGSDCQSALYGLRLWHNLSIAQRGSLFSGNTVPLISLPPAAKTCLSEFLYRLGQSEEASVGGGLMGAVEIDAAPAMPLPEGAPSPDPEITQILPGGPPPATSLSLRMNQGEAIAAFMEIETVKLPMVLPIAEFAEMRSMAQRNENDDPMRFNFDKVKAAVSQTMTLDVLLGPRLKRTLIVQAGFAPGRGAYGPIGSLPPALLARLRAEEMKIKNRAEPPPPPSSPR